jgi:hypothetical protein
LVAVTLPLSLTNPFLANPFLANPSLANPLLANPLLANPLLANPLLANPFLVEWLAPIPPNNSLLEKWRRPALSALRPSLWTCGWWGPPRYKSRVGGAKIKANPFSASRKSARRQAVMRSQLERAIAMNISQGERMRSAN